jgi:hypothetical protein
MNNIVYSKIPCEFCGETKLQWIKRKKPFRRTHIYTVKCVNCETMINGDSLEEAIKNWEKENVQGKNKQKSSI